MRFCDFFLWAVWRPVSVVRRQARVARIREGLGWNWVSLEACVRRQARQGKGK